MHIQTSNQERFNLGYGDYSLNWGAHVAGLYETEKERDDILFGFLEEGLRQGDLDFYVPAERTEEDFREKFSSACPHCRKQLGDDNMITISSDKEVYYPNGTFSPFEMDKSLGDFFIESQKKGKRHVRATAEMIWALEAIPGREHLFAYESRLNYFIPSKPWISICLYNISKFSGSTILDVLRTHPWTLNKGVLTENPYYQNPDQWLKENAPEFLTESKSV